MTIELEIGKYSENKNLGSFQKMAFSSIEEAVATIEFLKLGYDSFKKGESLVVRLGEGTKPYLLDYSSIIPILELRKELEEKYNNSIAEKDEIQFKINTKPEKESLNSNFYFEEDENTKYAKTSTGDNLPFKLFRTDDTSVGSNLLRESQNSGENSDFALIERRFSENNALQFFGPEKIESHNDIAWLFKSLEDETVEHAFLVYDFEDKGYFVQHISTGSFNAALIDNKQIIGNIIEANPSSITLVHNHPSGNLKASKADANILEKLKKALQNTDVKVNDGIIINLRSGKYLIFNEKLLEEQKQRTNSSKQLSGVQAYSFSKQVLVENFQPIKVTSPEEVAAYITSQKFGVSDKNEMLVLNSQLNIVGKFILPTNNQENFIIEKVSKFGGSNCVLYGNNITPELIDFYSKRLENSNITITDAILLKSENGLKMWESFIEEGKMKKNYNANTSSLSENYKSNFNHMEENQLSWSDRVITPKTKAYKDFIKEMENTSPEIFFMDGERNFTDREKKFMDIYKQKENGLIEGSYFTLKTIYNSNQNFPVDVNFNSVKELATYLINQNTNNKVLVLQNNVEFIEINIENEAEKQKTLSDLWAKELEKRTDLSSGLTKTQIDERQAYHFRHYEVEAKKLGIQVTPFIGSGEKTMDIRNKASELVNLLKDEKNILILTSSSQYTQVSIEINTLEDLIKNLEKRNIHEGHSLEIRLFGTQEGFNIKSQDVRHGLLSELIKIQKELELKAFQKEIHSYKNAIDPDSNPLSSFGRDSDFIDDLFDDIENGVGDLWKKNPKEEIIGKISFYGVNGEIVEVMKYTSNESYLNALKRELDSNMGGFKYETLMKNPELLKKVDDLIYDAYGEENLNSIDFYKEKAKKEIEIIGGKIKDIADESIRNPESIKQYDQNTQNLIKQFNNKINNVMEAKQNFDQVHYLKDQLKYLGFGENEKLHKDLETGIDSPEKKFEIKTVSDKTLPGNNVEFNIKFSKSDQGGVFLNSYDATLTNDKNENISQNFKVSKENSFTAKEAVNLLEGRSVKIEFDNPKTNQHEQAFVKLNLSEEKNQYGNYNFQTFHQNYGIDAAQIVEKSNLIFDKPEYKDSTIKSLEKGNVVKVKFEIEDKTIEGKAVLNAQYKTLNLYDSDMNRINTNKPLQGIENDNKHEKSNVREQSMSRGI